MSLLASKFVNPPKDSQEYNAILRAIERKPKVVVIGIVGNVKYFAVTSNSQIGYTWPVRFWPSKDKNYFSGYDVVVGADGELYLSDKPVDFLSLNEDYWIECFCPAASPPHDPSLRNLICWLPKSCYHMAAVLLWVAQEES